ncbi:MAG: CopG family transcriptional regulator [Corynebacterium sp.]|nr:CopG family transcriptional regulator [Corynebacterium sp.]
MAMTLRLSAEQDRALTLLAAAQGTSKQEAAARAIVATAAKMLIDAEVAELARSCVAEYATMERRIKQTPPRVR